MHHVPGAPDECVHMCALTQTEAIASIKTCAPFAFPHCTHDMRPLPPIAHCLVHRLPPTEPSMGRYMSDSSKLQRSAVSLQAAASLMTTQASTQASSHAKPQGSVQAKTQGSSGPAWSPAPTIEACMGVCQAGLCTVNFGMLHCCMAHERMAEQYLGGLSCELLGCEWGHECHCLSLRACVCRPQIA